MMMFLLLSDLFSSCPYAEHQQGHHKQEGYVAVVEELMSVTSCNCANELNR